MKWLPLFVLLAGCRLRFDEQATADATIAGDSDGANAARCTATKIEGFSFGAGVTDLAAAQLPQGYAIGAVFGASTFWGVHLDPLLAPDTPTPNQTSPVIGFAGMYTNGTMFFDGTNLDGGLSIADGTAFQKTFPTDMTEFYTSLMRTGQVGEPSIARAGAVLYSTWFDTNALHYVELGADGTPMGLDVVMTFATATITAVSVASGLRMAAVSAQADDSCELYSADAATASGAMYTAGSCAEPYLIGDGNVEFSFVYSKSGSIFKDTLTLSGTALDAGGAVEVAPGSKPQLLRLGATVWLVWTQGAALRMAPLDDPTDATIGGAPAGAPEAYQVAGDRVFAVWGENLYAIGCP